MSVACSIRAGLISVFLKEGETMGSCATAQNRGWRSMSLDLEKAHIKRGATRWKPFL